MRLTPSHFHILLSVAHEPSHGYAIMQEVRERTEGRVKLGPGSLYWAIKRLVDAEMLEETAAPSLQSDGPGRRYYSLTSPGRDVLRRELELLADIVRFAESQELIQSTEEA